ncbi:tankyrase-1 [Copidosoma floridanum]|uniref:tankyrase-1 n=1 Tax=Copidosoma floridanum TaxID=29053 RepID=UPI0006C97E71|nr:tankyrase-1 [Copidosoma floridanum]
MQAEAANLCTMEDFDATLIPVEILPCDVTRSRPMDSQSIVELGKQLLECAKIGDTDLVRDLMCRGAPFTTDWLGTSALHHAAQNNHLETAEVLLRAGISRDARTKVDRTPLHMAAYEGHHQMAQLLLNYGAEVDSRDMLKMTPLHWAVEQEHIEVLLILLENGANPHSVCKFNRTPLTLALEHQRLDFIELLQQEREMVNIQQEELDSSDIEVATQNLMQLEAERQREEQERIEIEQQQQQETASANKKQRLVYHPVAHPMVDTMNDEDEQYFTEIHHSNIQEFLKENGLTIIDNDATIVENAMESGHHVVLTEAGKLALTQTKPINVTPRKKVQLNPKKESSKKIVKLRTDQIMTQSPPSESTSKGPNILKRSGNNEMKRGKKIILTPIAPMPSTSQMFNVADNSTATTSNVRNNNVNVLKSEPLIFHMEDKSIENIFEINSEKEQITNIDELNRQLAQARKQIKEYRRKLKKKEEEVELYKKQLQILMNKKTLK